MAALAQSVQQSPRPLGSYWEFLKEELVPYPGRAALVGRMVMAATLAMLITMTFRLPYGAYCAIYALAISRESTQITLKTAVTRIASYSLGAVYVLIGATLFVDDPLLRLLWVIGTMFLTFYAMSAMSTFVSAVDIGYLIVLTVPLWDEHISGEQRLEATLWAVFALTISCAIAVVVELFFEATRPGNDLLRSIADRLTSVEAALLCYGRGARSTRRRQASSHGLRCSGHQDCDALCVHPTIRAITWNKWARLWLWLEDWSILPQV